MTLAQDKVMTVNRRRGVTWDHRDEPVVGLVMLGDVGGMGMEQEAYPQGLAVL